MGIDIWSFSYRILGKIASRWTKYFKDLSDNILKAGINASPDAYISFLWLSTITSFAGSFIISYIYFYFIQGFTLFHSIILAISTTVLFTLIVFIIIYAYPSIRAGMWARRIDEDLPYAVAQMNVMAIAGATPENIFRSVATTSGDAVGEFFQYIVRDIDLLGYDLVTAIRKARDRSPSKVLESFLGEIEAVITSGGDLPSFLDSYNKELLGTKAIQAKEFSETLSTLAEVFLILVIVFPLLMIIILSIMSIIGGTVFGLDASTLMWILTYVIIPAVGVVFLAFLDQIMPRGE